MHLTLPSQVLTVALHGVSPLNYRIRSDVALDLGYCSDRHLYCSGVDCLLPNRDILIWTDENGDGKQWRQQSVSYIHNELAKNNSSIPKFTSLVNNSESRQSTSYTSLLRTGPRSGIITYGIIINKTGTATEHGL